MEPQWDSPADIPSAVPESADWAQCDIIIPIYNNVDDTRLCLEHIRANTGPAYRLVLVDDCSDNYAAQWLENIAARRIYGPTLLVRRQTRGGWTGATNAGLALSRAPFICLMNNDTLAAPGWLDRLLYHFDRQPALGLMQPAGNEAELRREMNADLNGFAARIASRNFGIFTRTSYISGFCLVMRRSLYRTLGPFDPAFDKGLWADHDYCRKAQDLGYFSAVAEDSLVLHLQGRTMGRRSEAVIRANLSAERLFISRWGYKQGVYWRPDIPLTAPEAAAQMAKLVALADRGNMIYVALAHGETPERVLAAHGLPRHSNIKFETPGLPLPKSAWCAFRYHYQRYKRRVRIFHWGNLADLDLRCRPLDELPPREIAVVYRGK